MKASWLKSYDRLSGLAPAKFALAALMTFDRRKKLSIMNRQRDYVALLQSGDARRAIHREVNGILLEKTERWPHYDYGEGYLYQSFEPLGFSGYRQTAARVEALGLRERLKDRRVLDVGTNTGAILCSVHDVLAHGFGIDINPYLVRIAAAMAKSLGTDKLEFQATAFEDLPGDSRFDAVLSLANHSTYDENTKQSIEDYFARCARHCEPGGILIFESHPPAIEDADQLARSIAALEQHFEVEERFMTPLTGFLDKDRTCVIARRREDEGQSKKA